MCLYIKLEKGQLCLLLLSKLGMNKGHQEERISVKKMTPPDQAVGGSQGVFLIVIEVGGPSLLWVESPRNSVLGSIGKPPRKLSGTRR